MVSRLIWTCSLQVSSFLSRIKCLVLINSNNNNKWCSKMNYYNRQSCTPPSCLDNWDSKWLHKAKLLSISLCKRQASSRLLLYNSTPSFITRNHLLPKMSSQPPRVKICTFNRSLSSSQTTRSPLKKNRMPRPTLTQTLAAQATPSPQIFKYWWTSTRILTFKCTFPLLKELLSIRTSSSRTPWCPLLLLFPRIIQ